MIKKNYYFLSLGLFLILFLASCSKTVETQSEKYFKYLNEQDYDAIKSLGSETKLDIIKSPDIIADISKEFYMENGEVEEFEKYNQSSPIKEELNFWKTILYFECKTSKNSDKIFYKLDFLQEGDDGEPLLANIMYSTNKTFIDDYEDNIIKAMSVVNEYYNCLDKGDGEGVIELLDGSLSQEDEFDDFFDKLSNKLEEFGPAENSYYQSVVGRFTDNQTVFHVVYMISTTKTHFFEKISIIKNGSDFKIFDYNYAKNEEDL